MKSFKSFIKEDLPFEIFSSGKGVKKSIRKKYRKDIGQRQFALELEFPPENWNATPDEDDIREMLENDIDPTNYYDEYIDFSELLMHLRDEAAEFKTILNNYSNKLSPDAFDTRAHYIAFKSIHDYLYSNKSKFDPDETYDTSLIKMIEDRYGSFSAFMSGVYARAYVKTKASKLESNKKYVERKKQDLSKYLPFEYGHPKVDTIRKNLKDAQKNIKDIKSKWYKISWDDVDIDGFVGMDETSDHDHVVDNFALELYSSAHENYPKQLGDFIKQYKKQGNDDWYKHPFFNLELFQGQLSYGSDIELGFNLAFTELDNTFRSNFYSLPTAYFRYVVNEKGIIQSSSLDVDFVKRYIPVRSTRQETVEAVLEDAYIQAKKDVFDIVDKNKTKNGKETIFEFPWGSATLTKYFNQAKEMNPDMSGSRKHIGDLVRVSKGMLFDPPKHRLEVFISYGGKNDDGTKKYFPTFILRETDQSSSDVIFESPNILKILKFMEDEYNEKMKGVDPSYRGLSRVEIKARLEEQVEDAVNEFWNMHGEGLSNYIEWNYGGGREERIEDEVRDYIDENGVEDIDAAVEEAGYIAGHHLQLDWVVEPDYTKVEFKSDGPWSWKDVGNLYKDLDYLSEFETNGDCSCHIHIDDTLAGDNFAKLALILMFDESEFTDNPDVVGINRPSYTAQWAQAVRPAVFSRLNELRNEYNNISSPTSPAFYTKTDFLNPRYLGQYPGIRLSSFGTMEFRYPSAELLDDPKQILENIQYFSSLMSIAKNQRIIRKHYRGGYLVAAKTDKNGKEFLMQILNSDRYDRRLLDPEMKDMMRKYG